MQQKNSGIQYLLTVPPGMAGQFEAVEQRTRPDWFATCDPAGSKLGSGGGTINLLGEAWKATGNGADFSSWINQSKKLIVHGGGQSRRLPAYAPVGKLFMPLPAFRWALGHRLDQSLLDLQLPDYERVLRHAPENLRTMVTSGDVFLKFGKDLPPFPEVDVLGLGMWVTPEKAKDFGVFFCPRRDPRKLAFFLQKPTAARIRELASEYLYLIDTGMWLLSEKAIRVLSARSGWDLSKSMPPEGHPAYYELYSDFGLALGSQPVKPDDVVGQLTSAVVPLPTAEFYHLGTSRQLIETVSALENRELDETKLGLVGAKRHPDQFLLNSRFEYPLRLEENRTLWVENSHIPSTWKLKHDHVLTGVPDNSWDLHLEAGICLDFIPVGENQWCVRFYGIQDSFSGGISDTTTKWMDRPAPNWFFGRGLSREAASIPDNTDMQMAKVFPVLRQEQLDPRFIEWLFAAKPAKNENFARFWLESKRLSAAEIADQVDLTRLYSQRARNRERCLQPLLRNHRWSVFFKLDLEATAKLWAGSGVPLPAPMVAPGEGMDQMLAVREQMFHGAVHRLRADQSAGDFEETAFARLREMIVKDAQVAPVHPQRHILEDQIVWGRSPVRLDLAGGWTDTPPYCLEHGGRVVNLAVDLNGQPPIQVFARLCPEPRIVMRSIDLGVEEVVNTYEDLAGYNQPGKEFSLAKAAFALSGFLPKFHTHGQFKSLRQQLEEFGGGIEVTLLSAVPKGSGLGTSSILAATLLATLSDVCGLNWDKNVLFTRTLALEQLLTTGGGWQDQAGGIFRSIKLLETEPGLVQKPTLRWLPEHLFDSEHANKVILLYYTGITRLAKNILHEVVRGVFLNTPGHLQTVEAISENALSAFNAIQKSDYEGLVASIRQSWRLNQQLDAGTNPPAVQAILNHVQDYLAASKLLGAGGGGYMLMLAKDPEAAMRIKKVLAANPPNPRARFVQFGLSQNGLQLTRS